MLITNTGVLETIASQDVRDTVKLESWCHEGHQYVLPNAETIGQRVQNIPVEALIFVSSELVQRSDGPDSVFVRIDLDWFAAWCREQACCYLRSRGYSQREFGTARGVGPLNGLVFEAGHLNSNGQESFPKASCAHPICSVTVCRKNYHLLRLSRGDSRQSFALSLKPSSRSQGFAPESDR